MKPRISVCLTHYNRPEKLGATLASLAAQTRVPDEVFVWDDCSPKDPTAVAREWAGRFPHFVYHRNATNLGMPGNLNAVVSQATGDLVANLHDADIFAPTLLEKWADALERHPEAVLVFCRDSRWENLRFVEHWTPEPLPVTPGREFFQKHYLGRIDSLIWGTVMMRRSVYQKLLPFDPQYKNWADVDMWIRACGEGAIAFLPEKLIELDHSPTEQRTFSYARSALVQAIMNTNIVRLLQGDERRQALRLQLRAWRRLWIRWLAGGLRHGDWNRVRQAPRFFTPLTAPHDVHAKGTSEPVYQTSP